MRNTTWNGECLFDDNRNDNKYNNNDEYNDAEDGKGSRGVADDGEESDYDGHNVIRGPSFGGVGHRMSIVGPHAASAAIIDNKDNNDLRRGGEA